MASIFFFMEVSPAGDCVGLSGTDVDLLKIYNKKGRMLRGSVLQNIARRVLAGLCRKLCCNCSAELLQLLLFFEEIFHIRLAESRRAKEKSTSHHFRARSVL